MLTGFLTACIVLFSHTCVALAELDIFCFFLCVLLFLVALSLAAYLLCSMGRGNKI